MRKLIQSVKAFIVLAFTKLKHFYIDSNVKHKEPELYSKEWFIRKFEAIPEEEIGGCALDAHCANWHLGVKEPFKGTEESLAMAKLFRPSDVHDGYDAYSTIYPINDGIGGNSVLGSTPKERILNKLKSLPDVQAV